MWNIIIFFGLCLVNFSNCVTYRLSDEEYYRMPPVIHLDPYESCMRDPGAVYCTGYVAFVSDEPNALLTQMQEYTEHTAKHYNHTAGLYGICITKSCAAFYNKSDTIGDLTLVLEACQNKTLWDKYGLRSRVQDKISCLGDQMDKPPIGIGHIIVAAAFIALFICNAVGSLYDFCSQRIGSASSLYLCFSIRRNWRKLVDNTVPDRRVEGFKALHGIRAILMTLVLTGHSLLPSIVIHGNSKFIEEQYDKMFVHIFLNGTLIMQIFLMMSGTLLVFNVLVLCETTPLNWSMLPRAIIKRWLRLTPTYALVLGFTATWLEYFGTGPLWDAVVQKEIKHCQRDWWGHMLYINNYFDDSHCMPQSWYLAADTQLYILGVIVFVCCKTPRSRAAVLAVLCALGVVLPGLHTYYQDLDGILIVSPSAALGFFINDRTFNNVYKRGHTNLTSYALGLSLGYLLYYLQKIKFDASKYKQWRPAYEMLLPVSVAMILCCKAFYMDGPRVSVFWRTAIASTIRPAFGLLYAVLVFGLFFKFESVYRGLFEWSGWRYLSRVSYSAYLLHVAFIRTTSGVSTTVIHGGYVRVIEIILFNVMVTYISSVIFWLTVEAPLVGVAKRLLDPKKPEPPATKNVNPSDCQSERNDHVKAH